jgi:hypothetical protein
MDGVDDRSSVWKYIGQYFRQTLSPFVRTLLKLLEKIVIDFDGNIP